MASVEDTSNMFDSDQSPKPVQKWFNFTTDVELKSSVKPYYALGGHGTTRLEICSFFHNKCYAWYAETVGIWYQ